MTVKMGLEGWDFQANNTKYYGWILSLQNPYVEVLNPSTLFVTLFVIRVLKDVIS